MRQVLEPGALGRPRGSGWRGRWEGGSGWGTHTHTQKHLVKLLSDDLEGKMTKTRINVFPSAVGLER